MSQDAISFETRSLAERLVSHEARSRDGASDDGLATCPVCEKLRVPLVTFAGSAGFNSLLVRALTLAKRESPALQAVQVQTDGSLHGVSGEAALAHPTIVAHLLSLLITFIGEGFTMRLLLDIWPDLPEPGLNPLGKEAK